MIKKSLLAVIAVVFLAFPSWAKDEHSHSDHSSSKVELKLNQGKKWQGDDNMHKGMGEIRKIIAEKLDAIHKDSLVPQDYQAMSKAIQSQIDFMASNCKLSPEVDEQLHIVLGQIIDGSGEMEKGKKPHEAAVKVVKALNAYGKHFEHPGWKKLGKYSHSS